jgi:hypothetical protein
MSNCPGFLSLFLRSQPRAPRIAMAFVRVLRIEIVTNWNSKNQHLHSTKKTEKSNRKNYVFISKKVENHCR